MNLKEVRKKVVEISGRYDLVVDIETYNDNGANYYINNGQKYLDRRGVVENNTTEIFKHINPGDFYVFFKNYRNLLDVRFFDKENNNIELKKIDTKDFYSLIQNTSCIEEDFYYYTFLNLTTNPSQDSGNFIDLDGFNYLFDVTLNTNYEYTGIVFTPKATQEYTLKLTGKFLSTYLISDEDISFWSINYPSLLVRSTLMQLEIDNRNTTGVKDWSFSIDNELNDIEKDLIEADIIGKNQMKG